MNKKQYISINIQDVIMIKTIMNKKNNVQNVKNNILILVRI